MTNHSETSNVAYVLNFARERARQHLGDPNLLPVDRAELKQRCREGYATILRAVNSFDDLLDACIHAQQLANSLERSLGDWDVVDATHLEVINAAIAKATGKEVTP